MILMVELVDKEIKLVFITIIYVFKYLKEILSVISRYMEYIQRHK